MSKDICVFIPSRDNPSGLNKTIQMLWDTCHSSDNFDIVVAVDDDQIDLYNQVANEYPEIIFLYPQRKEKSWANIHKAHFDFLESHEYYFSWWVVDDFYGLEKHWDKKLVSKKDVFEDGIFCLHTRDPMGRNLNALTSQYRRGAHWVTGELVLDPIQLIFHYHEMLVLATTKWWLGTKKEKILAQFPVFSARSITGDRSIYSSVSYCRSNWRGLEASRK